MNHSTKIRIVIITWFHCVSTTYRSSTKTSNLIYNYALSRQLTHNITLRTLWYYILFFINVCAMIQTHYIRVCLTFYSSLLRAITHALNDDVFLLLFVTAYAVVLWRPIKIDVTNWALSNIPVYPSRHTVIQHEAALLVFIGRVVLLIKLNLPIVTHELILNLQIKHILSAMEWTTGVLELNSMSYICVSGHNTG